MAGTFADVQAALVAQVLNTHPSTSALFASAMVRQLANLQSESLPFMEITGAFNTVAAQATYTSAVSGFPKSLLRFDRLWYDLGNYARPLIPVDIATIRALQEQPPAALPLRICWQDEALQFGPAPAGIYTVKWDAILDARKDTATGNTITEATGTYSNPWFTTGAVPYMHLVWADYYMTSPDTRPDMASNHTTLAGTALGRLRQALTLRQEMNQTARTPNAFDTYDDNSSLRLSQIFPGAPV